MWFDIIKFDINGWYDAKARLYGRGNRNPTVEEVDEELKNPISRKEWEESHSFKTRLARTRPKNYNKIFEIVRWLKVQNKTVDRQNILEELVDLPTNEDNEAIEFILGE